MKKPSKSLRPGFAKAANNNVRLTKPRLARALFPPHDGTKEKLHGVTVKDPFRPLEKLNAPETAAWVARENAKFKAYMQGTQKFQDEALAFFESAKPQGMRESMPKRRGDIYICNRKAENAERWSVYVKDVPDYGAPARLLLDPLQIDPSGKTGIESFTVTRDGKTAAYALSKSGSDKWTLRFMDITTGKDLDLVYTDFRSAVTWDRDGQGFHYERNIEETKSNEVRHHKMGTLPSEDTLVYAPATRETDATYFRIARDSTAETGSYEWISASGTEPGKNSLLIRPLSGDADFREVFPFHLGSLSPIEEVGGRIYAVTDVGAKRQKLVSFDVNDPAPEKWHDILPEDPADLLKSAFVWQKKIFAVYSHDTGEVLKVFDLDGKYLHDAPIPQLSTFSINGFRAADTTCLIVYDNFKERGNVYRYDSVTNEMSLHKKSNAGGELKDCIVERLYATSRDGTKVPMSVIRGPDTRLDGTAAVLLYGYGGFDVSLDPEFNLAAAEWVRAGGIYVQANLRGGGEYGQEWYDAGRKENKQNVFDDFIACGEHLIRNNYTSPERLAIEGGSNGGLLTLACALQRPDLFGAVVSDVPVADMFRFHLGSYYGYSWKSDYGDPDIKADFNVAAKYSPLHNVKKNFKHPPLLIKTDANDDRVLPWHSYKMTATMQARESKGAVTLLKVNTDGGHSGGMTEAQWHADVAAVHAFLDKAMGPVNQDAYGTTLAQKRAQPRGHKRK